MVCSVVCFLCIKMTGHSRTVSSACYTISSLPLPTTRQSSWGTLANLSRTMLSRSLILSLRWRPLVAQAAKSVTAVTQFYVNYSHSLLNRYIYRCVTKERHAVFVLDSIAQFRWRTFHSTEIVFTCTSLFEHSASITIIKVNVVSVRSVSGTLKGYL